MNKYCYLSGRVNMKVRNSLLVMLAQVTEWK